jgi:hypothetical protein
MKWRREGMIIIDIRLKLMEEHNIRVPERTLTKLLCQWGLRINRPPTKDSAELRARITEIFRDGYLTDAETSRVLEQEGFTVGQRKIARMRKEMGLFKKLNQGYVHPKPDQLQQPASPYVLVDQTEADHVEVEAG